VLSGKCTLCSSLEILAAEGQTVKVGQQIAVIASGEEEG
jgi:pyruvate/2-oxoglutarate dehydrogenase complex dihydrolipoamide acyltransferase (E2) component